MKARVELPCVLPTGLQMKPGAPPIPALSCEVPAPLSGSHVACSPPHSRAGTQQIFHQEEPNKRIRGTQPSA